MVAVEKQKILVVDDEPEIRELLVRMLSRHYNVDFAIDGMDALDLTEKESFDLMIVDLNMPRMSGQELVNEIRVRGDAQMVFIILTGHGTFKDAHQLLADVKISDFLNKPVGRQELHFSVDRALRESSLLKTINEHNQSLEEQVRIRTEKLIERNIHLLEINDKLEKSNKIKSVFLSRMSHELRTPLNTIVGFGQLQDLLDRSSQEFQKITQGYNQEILQAGEHLLQMIEDMLEFSAGANELSIYMEPVVLHDVILESISSTMPFAEKTGISINYQQSSAIVKADNGRLKQVVDNVLNNAVKFNRSSGSINVKVTEKGGQVEISIQDTGIGIDSEDERIVFEPLTRGARAEKKAIPGAGIGLAFCRFLINQMNGSIDFSQETDGTTFYLRLEMVGRD